ncbi:hypothetical protein A6P39_004335 [Streptomyces sp. FXJ1.172]|uniref:NucA/NucB deoxyribonuclease domain-containing protein n=1 Tax=Streptomyces sp. FXJ1.172 TaxID=710705 RepID=UPI0007CF0E5D|nr:hypothetical protein [Streptomyces sp. FXJ1.172]WEO93320.1 hypothetical protein A6P39_004335 [Streptomyces sp. FXJ1.172]
MIFVAVLLLAWPTAASASTGHTVHKVRKVVSTYIITDPSLLRSPQHLIAATDSEATLRKMGYRAVGEPGAAATPRARANGPDPSYVVSSSRFPNGQKPADPYDYATPAECQAHIFDATRSIGWIKNRYSYCNSFAYVRFAHECDDLSGCHVVGHLVATPWIYGNGKIGGYQGTSDRWAHFSIHFTPLKVTGVYTFDGFLTITMSCKGYIKHERDDSACHIGDGNGRTAFIPLLKQDDEFHMDLVSDAYTPGPFAGPQIASGVFQIHINVDLPGFEPVSQADGPEGGMRFDSAWYLAPNSPTEQLGSVFDRARPGMSYNEDDNAIHDVAEHIRGARANPAATDPYAPQKHLAGAVPSDPVHRLAPGSGQYQNDRSRANRSETSSFCKSQWMEPKPSRGVWECDEYPFASTYEGSARYRYDALKYKNWWSAAWVTGGQNGDNGEAGRRLGRWYTNDRILDGDPFFIPVEGSPGTAPIGRLTPVQAGQDMDVFGDATNRHESADRYVTGHGWSGWNDLGGYIVGDSSAVAVDGNVEVFGHGPNLHAYQKVWTAGNGWSGWKDLGGNLIGDLSAISFGHQVQVFGRGPNHHAYQKVWDPGTGWSGWNDLGGSFAGDVTAIQYGGQAQVFGVGDNNHAYQKVWDPQTGWSGWNDLGGSFVGDLSAIQYGEQVQVFGTGPDNRAYQKVWDTGTGWSGWNNLGGQFITDLSVIQYGEQVQVFGTGPNHHAYQKVWDTRTGWSGWNDLGGYIVGDLSAIQYGEQVQVFGRGSNGHADQKVWDTRSGWSGWHDLGGQFA